MSVNSLEYARLYASLDLPTTVLEPGTKHFAFRDAKPLNRTSMQFHLARRNYNIGILLRGSDIMVVDCDTPEAYRFAEDNGLIGNMVSKTYRMIHSFLRHDIRLPTNRLNNGIGIDYLFNCAVPVYPSWIRETNHQYTWLRGPVHRSELALFPKHLIEVKRTPIIPLVSKTREALFKYINCITAHSGSNGHGQAYRCACKIAGQVEDIREGLAIFLNWNSTNAIPPFDLKACEHKIRDAYRKVRGQ